MRVRLRRHRHDPASPAEQPRNRRTRTALLAGGLGLLGLAAMPAGSVVSTGGELAADLGDRAAQVTTTAAAGTVSLAAELAPPPAPAPTPPSARRARTVIASPTTPTAQTADQPSPEQGEEPDEPDGADEPDATSDPEGGEDVDDEASAGAAEDSVWDRLADCESGDWDADGNPRPGTARWDYGLEFTHPGYEQFQGGLNFHPGTWDAYRDPGMPDHAGRATRAQEIVVAERVRDAQGWGAWPVCSEMIDLR